MLTLAIGGVGLVASGGCAAGPPPTLRREVVETLHGVELVDPYRWLEDQDSEETRRWIDAQNRYTYSVLSQIPARQSLKRLFSDLLTVDQTSVPLRRGKHYFFEARKAGDDLAKIYFRHELTGRDQLLVDSAEKADPGPLGVSLLDVSQDGSLIGYSLRCDGEDEVTLLWKDVVTGVDLEDVHPKRRYSSVAVTPEKDGFFYSVNGQAGPALYFHVMGTAPEDDQRLFGAGFGPEDILTFRLSPDGRYLVASVATGWSRSRLYLLDRTRSTGFVPVVDDLNANFSAKFAGDNLYILTNWQAPNYRLFSAPLHRPTRENWRLVLPETDVVVEDFLPVGGKLAVHYLRDVHSELLIFDRSGKRLGTVSLPDIGSVESLSGQWNDPELFYRYSSFHVPPVVYRYDVDSGERLIWAQQRIGIETQSFEIKQVSFASKDGTQIPMFLVHPRNLELTGGNPTYLTGYGGFNVSLLPTFSPRAAAWVSQGGVYAVANLRGGGEAGERWHRAGIFENKQNVFDDFISAAEWLVEHRYTRPEKLAIAGRSNGGLLVGAAFTQRPELFQAAICSFPLLDMVRYHKFLVASFWTPEYGSSEDPDQFPYLLDYSPYHNVVYGADYPAVLFITGDADTRVAPLHARKMTALMQYANGGGSPILLDYDTEAGHAGEMPVSKRIEQSVKIFSFLFWQLDIAAP